MYNDNIENKTVGLVMKQYIQTTIKTNFLKYITEFTCFKLHFIYGLKCH